MAEEFILHRAQHRYTMSTGQKLLVLGAGPKGIAIAAKRAALDLLGHPVPELEIIDRLGVAAHWTGRFGFTDGSQPLGTRPEKDVGFPYASTYWDRFNKAVDKKMLLLSWHSYLIATNRYADWIDRGRFSPTHSEWSEYIRWVAEKVGAPVNKAELRAISITEDNQRWRLTCQTVGEEDTVTLEGDGLVMTGPGTPLTIPGQPASHPRVMDGANFWLHVEDFDEMRRTVKKPLNIGVIGTGETAAAVVIALVEVLRNAAFIEVISPNGVIYSRDEGFEENRLFSDPDGRLADLYGDHQHKFSWLRLSEQDRREFLRRTDRGVFSRQAMNEIGRARNVRSVVGTAVSMSVSESQVFVDVKYRDTTERDEYDYVIVAIGFDPLWFTRLLDSRTYSRMSDATQSFDRRVLEHGIDTDLSLKGFAPRLHLPMLAGLAQGPGFPNLSCLGLLSDRILFSYHATS